MMLLYAQKHENLKRCRGAICINPLKVDGHKSEAEQTREVQGECLGQ